MKRCIKILMTLLSFCFLASLFVACTKQQDSVVKHSIYFVDGTHTIDTIETGGFEVLDLPQAEKIDGFTYFRFARRCEQGLFPLYPDRKCDTLRKVDADRILCHLRDKRRQLRFGRLGGNDRQRTFYHAPRLRLYGLVYERRPFRRQSCRIPLHAHKRYRALRRLEKSR